MTSSAELLAAARPYSARQGLVREGLHDCSVLGCSLSRGTQGPSPVLTPHANITHRVCVCPSLSSMYSLANGADGTTVGLTRSLGVYRNTNAFKGE